MSELFVGTVQIYKLAKLNYPYAKVLRLYGIIVNFAIQNSGLNFNLITTTTMKRFLLLCISMTLLLGVPAFSSCGSDEDMEILEPVAEHILGKWETTGGYMLINDKWEKHDDPDSPISRITYDFLKDDSMVICTTGTDGWTTFSMIPYKVEGSKVIYTPDSPESTVELLTADSLEMVSYFLHDPNTGDKLPEPIPYKWSFRRLDSTEQTLGEKLIGKWKFIATEKRNDSIWENYTDATTPSEATDEYSASGSLTTEMVLYGQHYQFDYRWKINNSDGALEVSMGENRRSGRIEFEGTDKLWIYYPQETADGAKLELRYEWSRIR